MHLQRRALRATARRERRVVRTAPAGCPCRRGALTSCQLAERSACPAGAAASWASASAGSAAWMTLTRTTSTPWTSHSRARRSAVEVRVVLPSFHVILQGRTLGTLTRTLASHSRARRTAAGLRATVTMPTPLELLMQRPCVMSRSASAWVAGVSASQHTCAASDVKSRTVAWGRSLMHIAYMCRP